MQDVTLLYYLKVWNAKLAGSPAVGDGAGAFATVFADVAGLPANLRMSTMLREIGFLLPRTSGKRRRVGSSSSSPMQLAKNVILAQTL